MFARSLCGSPAPVRQSGRPGRRESPMHARFLPPDDGQLRQEAPEQQQLIQITEYSVVLGNQRQSNQQPIPITTPTLLRLEGQAAEQGRDPGPGADPVRQRRQEPEEAGLRCRDPHPHAQLPLAQYPALLDLLRNQTVIASSRLSQRPRPTCTPARYARVEPRRAPGVNCLVLSRRASPAPEPLRESDAQRQETDHWRRDQ